MFARKNLSTRKNRRPRSFSNRDLSIEKLEPRQLLAGITFDAGVISVEGTANADGAQVFNPQPDQVSVVIYGIEQQTFDAATVSKIVFTGHQGNDWFRNDTAIPTEAFGNAGNDKLIGGSGDDMLSGGNGNDQLLGNEGNDRLFGHQGLDHVFGDAGDDQIWTGSDDDFADGAAGRDELFGGWGRDHLKGGADDDLVSGEDHGDYLFGDDGNDLLLGAGDADFINAGAGNDDARGGPGNDAILGELGDDRLSGNEGDDRIHGNDGNDTISGGDGDDVLNGRQGDDILRGNAGFDLLRGQSGSDSLDGGDDADDLAGGSGVDQLNGGRGNDDFINATDDSITSDAADFSADGDFEIRGAVSNLNTAAKTFDLLGLTVSYATARLEGNFQNGSLVKAEGNFANGILTAHEVEIDNRTRQDNFEARGFVTNLDTQAKTFELFGILVNYSTAQVNTSLAEGVPVFVEGNLSSQVVTAREIYPGNGQDDDNQVDRNFELRGVVTNLDEVNQTFELLGVKVDYSIAFLQNQFSEGSFVKVDGDFGNQSLTARQIELELDDNRDENTEAVGVISNLDETAQTFDILGMTVDYSNADLDESLFNGMTAEVEGIFQNFSINADRVRPA